MSDTDSDLPHDSPQFDVFNPDKALVLATGVADTNRWQVWRGGSSPEFITTNELREVATQALAIALVAALAPTTLTGNAPTGLEGVPIYWTDNSLILMS